MVAANDVAWQTKPCDGMPHAERKAKTVEIRKKLLKNL